MGWIILILVLAWLAVILWRAYNFNPKPQPVTSDEEVSFDRDAAVTALQTLVRFKTVSNVDPALEDDAEFRKLVAALGIIYLKKKSFKQSKKG